MSKRDKIVYFGVESKLFVWDYLNNRNQRKPNDSIAELDFEDRITAVCELNCTNSKSRWQLASEANQDCRYVIVATCREINLLAVKRDSNNDTLIV